MMEQDIKQPNTIYIYIYISYIRKGAPLYIYIYIDTISDIKEYDQVF